VKEKFSHDLQKLYEALPADQRVLTGTELEVLRTASQVYNDDKAFDYIRPEDALTAYKRFPDQVELDAVAKKLLAL
jgi:hypothetical protein